MSTERIENILLQISQDESYRSVQQEQRDRHELQVEQEVRIYRYDMRKLIGGIATTVSLILLCDMILAGAYLLSLLGV